MKKRLAMLILSTFIAIFAITGSAQDRLKTMPGYNQYRKIGEQIVGSVRLGTLNVTWTNASTFEYNLDGKQFRYDLSGLRIVRLSGVGGRANCRIKGATHVFRPPERRRRAVLKKLG